MKIKKLNLNILLCQLGLLCSILFFVEQVAIAQDGAPANSVVVASSANWGDVRTFPITEIVSNLGLTRWRDQQWSGRGQKVGVLDLGFGGIIELEQTLSMQVTIPDLTKDDYDVSPIIHGSEILEVIHGIAPGTELFACSYEDFDGYRNCIDWMIQSGVNIINHSAGVPALPLDGTNDWAKEVERVAREDILWINSAGNFANGYFRGNFTYYPGTTYHTFFGAGNLGDTLEIPIIGQGTGRVMLSWQGLPELGLEANMIDLDLEMHTSTGEVVSSSRPQTGQIGERPIEWLTADLSQRYWVKIRDVTGQAGGVRFVLFVEFASLPAGESQGSIIAPADSQFSLTVGALQDNNVAPYSSRGPISTGAIKPDLVAPGEIRLANGTEFVGTSAAAPVVAGVAALIWEANPTWTREQIYQYLKFSAVLDDTDIAGADGNYGQGRLSLPVEVPQRIVDLSNSSASESGIGRLPYSTSFDESGSIDLWEYDAGAWLINRLGGDNVLVGQGKLNQPIIVLSKASPEWLDRDDRDMLISFDYNVQESSGGLRMIFRESEAGYNALELFPGLMILKRNNPDNVDMTVRENENTLRSLKIPVNAEEWNKITLWLSGNQIYIYLNRQLTMIVEDQNIPQLVAGNILFQANSAFRQVRVDNFAIQRVFQASDHFENASIPPTWATTSTVGTTIEKETDIFNQYLRMRGEVVVSPIIPDTADIRITCRIWNEEGGYQIRLRDTQNGALVFDFEGGNLEVKQVDDFEDVEWSTSLSNFYNRGRWDDVSIEYIGNSLRIFRDGELRYSGTVQGRETLPAGVVRFVTSRQDILRLDSCLLADVLD